MRKRIASSSLKMSTLKKDAPVYIAGHNGMIGSALVRKLKSLGFENLVLRSRE